MSMKRILLSLLLSILITVAFSAPFKFLPYKITQPDGTVIECFVSGDEFFNWIHDKEGYSIIKGSDGYYYYATKAKGKIVASTYKVNSVDPKKTELKKWTVISEEEYNKKREIFNTPYKDGISKAPHTGQLNNLVIYIRFHGDDEISTTRQEYDDLLNLEPGYSLKSYYKEVSYNQLTINSTHYPDCADPANTNASYEDSHERSYFQPYDETTNPNGYNTDSARTAREHQLLADAVEWINNNYPVDASLDIDGDNDNKVDNVCFMIKGNSGGWNDLLWAHRWSLYTKTVYINGCRVYDYTFQPENQVGVRTLSHEMFHALGAPDLYHYYNGTNLSPVASWDIMESGSGHMSAYMKYKYAGQAWISDIPEINAKGNYTLHPLTSSTNNCYKIASPNSSSEFFIVEYRKKSGNFESKLPGEGLLVYRINTNFGGNADYDGTSVFDEVYIYRPGGTTSINGSPNSANFSSDVSRTEINDGTDPSTFLSDGSEGGLSISNISTAGETISFDVNFQFVTNPENFQSNAVSSEEVQLNWDLNEDNDKVMLVYNTENSFGTPEDGTDYSQGQTLSGGGEVLYTGTATTFQHQALSSGQVYYYKLWSVNSNQEYSSGITSFVNVPCTASLLPLNEDFSDVVAPSCWQNIDNIGAGQAWVFNNPNSYTFGSTTGDNGFALLDSDDYGTGNTQNAELISPLLDLSTYSTINLSFEHYYEHYQSEAELSYSIDGGKTWNVIDSWSSTIGSQTAPSTYNNNISTYVAGESNVYIRWRYEGTYGYYWFIDDISITGVSSGEPVALTENANDIQFNSATLNGTINANGNSITNIQFEYGTVSGNYTQTIATTPNTASGNLNTPVYANITSLSESTEYFYRVKCMNGSTTVYGEEKSFQTNSSDPIVTTGNVDHININLATLHATINANNNSITNIQFEYGTQSGSYSSSINANPVTADGMSDTPVQAEITGLSSNTKYYYRVKCMNGTTQVNGDEKSFTTEALPTVIISSTEGDITNSNPINILFSFSEAISSFIADDITITNATINSITNTANNDYQVIITPISDGEITLKLLENVVADLAGFGNVASDVFSIDYDSTVPTVEISSTESSTTTISPIPVSFTFSEDISGFEISDVSVTNGTAGNFTSTNAKNYSVDITPINNGNVTVQIAANSVQDDAENMNAASDVWSINYSSTNSIGELEKEGIKIYPNPSHGLLKIEYNEYYEGQVQIIDYSGRIIYSSGIGKRTEQKIDLTGQAKGIYLIRFTLGQKQISTQLVIQ